MCIWQISHVGCSRGFLENCRSQTVDLVGKRHILLELTVFFWMRISALMAVWADSSKTAFTAIPIKVPDGITLKEIRQILYNTHEQAWVHLSGIISWVYSFLPLVDIIFGKCVVYDSCRAQIFRDPKHRRIKRNANSLLCLWKWLHICKLWIFWFMQSWRTSYQIWIIRKICDQLLSCTLEMATQNYLKMIYFIYRFLSNTENVVTYHCQKLLFSQQTFIAISSFCLLQSPMFLKSSSL